MKIIGQIYEEDNYGVFVRLEDNRNVLSTRLRKLVVSITEKWILNPIIVNEKMEIIDGQGRFEALKSLHKPIPYIVSYGATSEDCRRMNKYNTRWTVLDFANSWAKSGKEPYILLLLTNKKTKFPISRIIRLCNHGAKVSSPDVMTGYELGQLQFDEEDMEVVCNIKKMADEIIEALQVNLRPNEAFYTSVKIASETDGYIHSHMLQNCALQRASYHQMSNLGNQLVEFERIYNFKTPNKKKLYFSDYMRNRGSNVRDYSRSYSPYDDHDVSTLKTIPIEES